MGKRTVCFLLFFFYNSLFDTSPPLRSLMWNLRLDSKWMLLLYCQMNKRGLILANLSANKSFFRTSSPSGKPKRSVVSWWRPSWSHRWSNRHLTKVSIGVWTSSKAHLTKNYPMNSKSPDPLRTSKWKILPRYGGHFSDIMYFKPISILVRCW